MKKETLITTVVGIVLGFSTALIILFTTTEKKKVQEAKKVIQPKITTSPPSLKEEKRQQLTLSEPEDGLTTTTAKIKIKGQAEKQSMIIIQSPDFEKALKNETVDFAIDVPLILGENTIRVTTYNQKTTEEKTLKVYYFNEQ
ncbi:MAG TPA: hypothetical protein VJH96_03915 [Patescibacteria group bacterium]|nr:hypothetical protein [Patescibacteria group bacterium]